MHLVCEFVEGPKEGERFRYECIHCHRVVRLKKEKDPSKIRAQCSTGCASCPHRGPDAIRIKGDVLGCKCKGIVLHHCEMVDELVTKRPLHVPEGETRETMIQFIDGWKKDHSFAGRDCETCRLPKNYGRKTAAIIEESEELHWRWFSLEDLQRDTVVLAKNLPWPIRGVVGVPRSGVMIASTIASWLNVPLGMITDEGFKISRSHGRRLIEDQFQEGPWIVIDDDTWRGISMLDAQSQVPGETMTAAIISRIDGYTPDIVLRRYLHTWLCEWRFFSSWLLPKTGFDFDGIFCEDCPDEDDDDGRRYNRFLQTVERKWVPRGHHVPLIATARMEKYRRVTLEWMKGHGLQVQKMVMGDWPTLGERTLEKVIDLKARAIHTTPEIQFFVESCPFQAELLSHSCPNHPIICPSTSQIFNKGKAAKKPDHHGRSFV